MSKPTIKEQFITRLRKDLPNVPHFVASQIYITRRKRSDAGEVSRFASLPNGIIARIPYTN